MIKKKQRNIAIAVLLSAGMIAGGVYTARNRVSSKEVQVYPAYSLNYGYGDYRESTQGTVTNSAVQEVKRAGGLVDSVKVKNGTKVKKGDVLIIYDKESVRLAVAADEAAIALTQAEIASAESEVSRLQSLHTAEEMPEAVEQTIHHSADPVSTLKVVDVGTKASEEEHIYYCTPETKVTAAMLQQLKDSSVTAEFRMFEENVEIGSWLVDGTTISSGEKTITIIREIGTRDEPSEDEPSDSGDRDTDIVNADPEEETEAEEDDQKEEPSEDPKEDDVKETRTEEEAPFEDWILGDGVDFFGDGTVSVDYSKKHYGSLTSVVPEEAEWDETVIIEPSVDLSGDNYAYSAKELAEEIKNQQELIKEKQMELKEEELKLQEDKLVSSDGSVKAAMDGIVTEVKSPEDVKEGETLITVKGESGLTITAYISEYEIRDIQLGEQLDVFAYESASSFTAEVTDVSFEPVEQSMGSGSNQTLYPVTARAMDEDLDLRQGESCQISRTSIETGQNGNLYLEQMFIRKDESGSYCMKADENNRLVKAYVQTGSSQYGVIEILSGIEEEDRIAFPYGKSVQEGSPVVDGEYSDLYS